MPSDFEASDEVKKDGLVPEHQICPFPSIRQDDSNRNVSLGVFSIDELDMETSRVRGRCLDRSRCVAELWSVFAGEMAIKPLCRDREVHRGE
jgi:hypothetical protein